MALAPIDPLVDLVLAGAPGGWQNFCRVVEPHITRTLSRRGFLGPLFADEDAKRDVLLLVLERLSADGHARLRSYVTARQAQDGLLFVAWLAVVTRRVAIDYLRSRPEYRDQRHVAGAAPGQWRQVQELPSERRMPVTTAGMTTRLAAGELLAAARGVLSDDQLAALRGWLQGEGFETIASAQGLADAREAERRVRAALERLRRHVKRADK